MNAPYEATAKYQSTTVVFILAADNLADALKKADKKALEIFSEVMTIFRWRENRDLLVREVRGQ
jgi:hypothetical protein